MYYFSFFTKRDSPLVVYRIVVIDCTKFDGKSNMLTSRSFSMYLHVYLLILIRASIYIHRMIRIRMFTKIKMFPSSKILIFFISFLCLIGNIFCLSLEEINDNEFINYCQTEKYVVALFCK